MARYALILTDTLTDTGKRYDFDGTPPDLSHKNPPMKLVPVVVSPDPAFDPAAEKLQRAADVITLTELTESQEVVAKTAQEQADYADQQDSSTKRTNVANSIATLRAWATEASAATVTSGNAVATLQVIVNRLGTFFDRFADMVEGHNLDQ